MIIQQALKERDEACGPIRVGVVGAGQMGEGLVCQMELMRGMRAFGIADVIPGRAKEVFRSAGLDDASVVETDDPAVAAQAVEDGRRVATTNASMLTCIPGLEIVVEATGVPEIGAQISLEAILARKHVLQMNVETDATVGYMLRSMARSAGVVYTLTAGDEPGTTMELFDFAQSLGFEVVCAGKGKNNPLDRTANPDTVAEKARVQMMNPKMLASFVDGTKTMVEMTSLANATGFVPDVFGMHGPEATPKNLAQVFATKDAGGVIEKKGVVDYALGIAPGVFVIFTSDHPKIIRDLGYLSMGPGPYYALYRPYHLTSLETPISIARAVLKGETTIATDIPPVAETVAVAKKDLKAGDTLDSLGGFTVYGMIDTVAHAGEEKLLPLGLAPGSVLTRDVRKGECLTYNDVTVNDDLYIVQLRRMQDKLTARSHNAS
jgi:predicted homoserine dehydrogenase-like protein